MSNQLSLGEFSIIITLHEKMNIFSPLERILVSGTSSSIRKLIQESWKTIPTFRSPIEDVKFLICIGCRKAVVKAWNICLNCIKLEKYDLISSTTAKKKYYVNRKILNQLDYAIVYYGIYNIQKYYLKNEVINASIAQSKGPTKLIDRMNRDKIYIDKINKMFSDPKERKAMKMDGSWCLCVKPFIKNYSRKGIKNIKARIQRFEIWRKERLKSYQSEYIFDYCRDEFVKGLTKIDTIKNIIREQEMQWVKIEGRLKTLQLILNEAGLVLHEDSAFCYQYIMYGIGNLSEIVMYMKEVNAYT